MASDYHCLKILTVTGTCPKNGTTAKTRETGGIVAKKWSFVARSNGPILIGGETVDHILKWTTHILPGSAGPSLEISLGLGKRLLS